jgi:hypothetical protein
VRELDADRSPSSAVGERFPAVRCALAEDGGDSAGVGSELPPVADDPVPVVGELVAVVRFDADDGCELAADVKFLADDRGKRAPRGWELALRGWELPYSRCELPP